MGMTTISLRGDETYKKALAVIAAMRGITMGDLVRETLDASLEGEMRPFLDRFVTNDGQRTIQNSSTVSTKAG